MLILYIKLNFMSIEYILIINALQINILQLFENFYLLNICLKCGEI